MIYVRYVRCILTRQGNYCGLECHSLSPSACHQPHCPPRGRVRLPYTLISRNLEPLHSLGPHCVIIVLLVCPPLSLSMTSTPTPSLVRDTSSVAYVPRNHESASPVEPTVDATPLVSLGRWSWSESDRDDADELVPQPQSLSHDTDIRIL